MRNEHRAIQLTDLLEVQYLLDHDVSKKEERVDLCQKLIAEKK
jgi:TolB-like protein